MYSLNALSNLYQKMLRLLFLLNFERMNDCSTIRIVQMYVTVTESEEGQLVHVKNIRAPAGWGLLKARPALLH